MRKFIEISVITILIMAYMTINVKAQILQPVHWSYAPKKNGKNSAMILIKATIDNGWHIYSVNQKDGGPLKTSFEFIPSKSYRILGAVSEPIPVTKFENAFNMDVNYFEKSVIFQQKITLTSSDAVVRGKVSFMTCNDEKCLPPDEVSFRIPVK